MAKFNVTVDSVEQLPVILRQAFREATSGAPRPVHLDFQGTQGEVVIDAEADLEVIVTQPREIKRAMEEAIASGKPAVVEVVGDIEGIAPLPWG